MKRKKIINVKLKTDSNNHEFNLILNPVQFKSYFQPDSFENRT